MIRRKWLRTHFRDEGSCIRVQDVTHASMKAILGGISGACERKWSKRVGVSLSREERQTMMLLLVYGSQLRTSSTDLNTNS